MIALFILQGDRMMIVFFEEFQRTGCEIKDISKFTDNKWLYFLNLIYRGIISGYINQSEAKANCF